MFPQRLQLSGANPGIGVKGHNFMRQGDIGVVSRS
jgi:succinyl-CoA synthetase alpha subunit